MTDEIPLPPNPAPRRKGMAFVVMGVIGFILGAGLVFALNNPAWLGWGLAKPAASTIYSSPNQPLPPEARVAALEARLSRIEQQAAASEGKTAHAESLLIAFAARRALDKGTALGPLEAQLQRYFGADQPDAVAAIITAARYPITLNRLGAELDQLAPQLANAPDKGSGWQQFGDALSNLFVLRRDKTKSPSPTTQISQIRANLAAGSIDQAVILAEQLPHAERLSGWTAAARRYSTAHKALDLLEQSALKF